MDEDRLYEEDYLENPGRREFLRDSVIIGSSGLLGIFGITTACKDNPMGPDIDDYKPATEQEGRTSMKGATDTVMGEKSYTYQINYDVELYTNKQGRYDLVVDVDTNGDGQYDLKLGMNYVTDGESRQNLQETARVKFKEIVKSDITTKDYLTSEFTEWMKSVL